MTTPKAIIQKYAVAISVVLVVVNIGYPAVIYLGIPLLLPLLLNLMMVHLGISALLGRISIKWLLAPIIAYGAWGVAVQMNRIITERNVRAMGLQSGIAIPVAPDTNLLFDKNDLFAESVRHYLEGGRVFQGSDELRIFRAKGQDAGVCRHPEYQKYGRVVSGGASPVWTNRHEDLTDCTFAQPESGRLSGLRLTRVTNESDFHTGRIIYRIDEQRPDGVIKPVGQFSFGHTQHWAFLPLFFFDCVDGEYFEGRRRSSRCEFQNVDDRVNFAIAGAKDYLFMDSYAAPRDDNFVAVQALAKLLGRKSSSAPPAI